MPLMSEPGVSGSAFARLPREAVAPIRLPSPMPHHRPRQVTPTTVMPMPANKLTSAANASSQTEYPTGGQLQLQLTDSEALTDAVAAVLGPRLENPKKAASNASSTAPVVGPTGWAMWGGNEFANVISRQNDNGSFDTERGRLQEF